MPLMGTGFFVPSSGKHNAPAVVCPLQIIMIMLRQDREFPSEMDFYWKTKKTHAPGGIFTPVSATMVFLGKSTEHDNQLVLPQNSKNSEFRAFF